MSAIYIYASGYVFLKPKWESLAREYNRKLVIGDPANHAELLEDFERNDIDIIANTWPGCRKIGGYTPDLIKKLGVKAIVHQGAGYEVVGDISAWAAAGTQVANLPNANAPSTANTAVFLTLAAMRKFNRLTTSLRAGQWLGTLKVMDCHDPEGQVVTIIGMGNIGRMIRDRLEPFQFAKIQYYNRSRLPADQENGTEYVSDLETVWRTSNVIIFACPYNKSTHHLFDYEQIKKCKAGVVVVNISRGGVIHEQALVDGLNSGQVGSVGLDVFEKEPEVHPDLLANEDVFLLPHASTLALETRIANEQELIDNVENYLKTGKVLSLVPELRK